VNGKRNAASCATVAERAAVLEIGCGPGRAETVVAEPGDDTAAATPPPDHRIGVRLRQHRADAAANRAEQRPFWIVAQARAVDIFLEVVMGGHRVPLTVLLAQLHPQPSGHSRP
jgi:hypothetical protein